MKQTLSIIIPLYNSSLTLDKLFVALNNYAQQSVLAVSVIFIDDGSIDDTFIKAKQLLSHQLLPIKLVKLNKNYGQHSATAIGLSLANTDFVATIDDDLQQNPSDLDLMYQQLVQTHADLVYGSYQQKKHHALRNLGTKVLQKILSVDGKDYSMVTSCRLMRKSVASIFVTRQIKTHFVDDFLISSAAKIETCVVKHSERIEGKSGYSFKSLFIFAIKILLLHSSFPLKVISRMGLVMSVLFFLLGCHYIYMKLAFDAALGFTSLIVAIFFSTGLILFSLGIIGEYIRRIWISKQDLDVVIIAENINS